MTLAEIIAALGEEAFEKGIAEGAAYCRGNGKHHSRDSGPELERAWYALAEWIERKGSDR